jgi:excisionase family DNA binding protein
MDSVNTQFPDTLGIERLLKGNEVARLLNVSRSYAYLLMQSGNLPVVRIGHSIRVRPSDLRNYITKNTIGENGYDLINNIDRIDNTQKNIVEGL